MQKIDLQKISSTVNAPTQTQQHIYTYTYTYIHISQ